ncbi:Pr6Pr family membrane protein [Lacisediminihabitans changchengi]|uniref:Pr6Pr family membrane protein n=1 Tax=Lacisediminihabitans changchengi TaxID=2787634 RepID=A0A934SJS4_9MICO|nr:Pr6Pr family membrane protein [Lacisediminihabitans changchengi]MBK4346644.1 Pr6Pr family membrane protein [Lacisediminihabitans changchengi]
MRRLAIATRVLIAITVIVAIVGQLSLSLSNWRDAGIDNPVVQVVNFFSFFTIESNVLTVVVALLGAWFLLRGDRDDRGWYLGLRAAAVTYMATTGIVYNLLLRGIELPQGTTLGWSNEILHVVAPAYLILDWLFAPGRRPREWKAVWPILIFPLVWGIYTLIRGPITFDAVTGKSYWYPYPFLNPNTSPEGYLSVSFYIVLIAAVIGLVGLGVVWVSKRPLPAISRG